MARLPLLPRWLLYLTYPCLMIVTLTACAREQSAEERQREKRDRKVERLSSAEGKFLGSAELASGNFIPFKLAVSLIRNPGRTGDEPTLNAQIRLGLLGGVRLDASTVNYDRGSGQITASFGSGGAGGGSQMGESKTLELDGTINDQGLADAKLTGASGQTYSIQAQRLATDIEERDNVELSSAISIKDDASSSDVTAALNLTRRSGDTQAEASSDMPRFPLIDGALRFPGVSRVAHRGDSIRYDALADTLDIYFVGSNGGAPLRLSFANISGNRKNDELSFVAVPALSGLVEMGSSTVGTVTLKENQATSLTETMQSGLPPENFVGKLIAQNGRVKWPTVARLEYLNSEGTSGAPTPLSQFPQMRLRISVCLNSETVFSEKTFTLTALDYLKSEGAFSRQQNGPSEIFNFRYTNFWRELTGQLVVPGETGGSTIALRAADIKHQVSCKDSISAADDLRRILRSEDRRDADPVPPSFLKYEGYISRNGRTLPMGVTVFPKRNPSGGNEEPSLQVTARIGFFGGANIASEPAVFNWGNGRISAAFTRPSGGAPLEFRATLGTESLDDAVLIGPNLGQSEVHLTADTEPYASPEAESYFNLNLAPGSAAAPEGEALLSVLALRNKPEGTVAPANIDLPVLPSIDASMRIDGLGQTPQVSTKVIYDVLRGTMDVYFGDASVLQYTDIFLTPTNQNHRPYQPFATLPGRMILGGNIIASGIGHKVSVAERWTIRDLPHVIYTGTYEGSGSRVAFKTVARIDYGGSGGRNTSEYPFASFPKLSLTVSICMGTSIFAQRLMDLESVDFLGRRLIFKGRDAGSKTSLDMVFEPHWTTLNGEFRDIEGSGGSANGARITLKAKPGSSAIECGNPDPGTRPN